ncbi:MAG: phosphoribosyltransferase family protein [Acidilobaceae archaeon]|nr:phosphoribosyltransferase family protein [Acidilobaceae archaeon]
MGRLTRADKLKYRLLAVESLRALRRVTPYSYKELSKEMNMDQTLIARYAGGLTVPSYATAQRIIETVRRSFNLEKILKSREGLLDLTPFLSNPHYLKLLAVEFYERFKGEEVSKILVPEAAGITLATALSLAFDAGLVVARRTKENPTVEYIEEHAVEPPSTRAIFYIPSNSLRKDDKVLVVDDIVQTGLTLSVMRKLVDRSGSKLVGVAAVVIVGEEWRKRVSVERLEAIVKI